MKEPAQNDPAPGTDDDRERRARAHTFSGGASGVIAIGSVPVFGWLAGLGMALLAGGNLLAAGSVRRDGRMSTAARTMIIVGGVAFAVFCVLRVTGVFAL